MPKPLVKVSLVLTLAAAAALAQSTTTAGRQQDLNYIANTLPSLAPNFFFQLDRTVYQNAVAALQARISSATDAEFYVGLEQLVALSRDMHTGLSIPFNYGYLSLSLYWFDDGLFVTSSAPEYS